MQRLVMTRLARSATTGDGHGALVELETSCGPLELRFTYEDAERLIAALQEARARIQDERVRSAKAPLPDTPNVPSSIETAIDPVNQVAVVRAHLPDHTVQDLRIPRSELAGIAQFLGEALKRFEAGGEMRQ